MTKIIAVIQRYNAMINQEKERLAKMKCKIEILSNTIKSMEEEKKILVEFNK